MGFFHSIGHAFSSAGHTLSHSAHSVSHAIEHTGEKTGKGIKQGATVVGHGIIKYGVPAAAAAGKAAAKAGKAAGKEAKDWYNRGKDAADNFAGLFDSKNLLLYAGVFLGALIILPRIIDSASNAANSPAGQKVVAAAAKK